MKKTGFAAFAAVLLALLLSCGSSAPTARPAGAGAAAAPAFTGDGGSGIRIAVLVPDAVGLPDEENYLPAMVQGVLVDNFSRFSAISVLDRLSLESVLMETESGIYQSAADFGQLGDIIGVHYVLTGSITRTSTGHNLQVSVVGTGSGNMGVPRATFSHPSTVAEMNDHTVIRRASMQLLTGMGVSLTDNARQELYGADTQQAINAQVALAQGIVAQRAGNTFETMLRFNEAASFNPALTEAVSRANAMSTTVRTGTLAQDVRNEIAWMDEWAGIMNEARDFLRGHTPVVARVVYDPGQLTMTNVNHAAGTVEFSLPVYFFGVRFPAAQVIADLNEGLAATGRQEDWGLMPLSPANIWRNADQARGRPWTNYSVDIWVAGLLGSGGRWYLDSRQVNIDNIDGWMRMGSTARARHAANPRRLFRVAFRQYGTSITHIYTRDVWNPITRSYMRFTIPADSLNGDLAIRLSAGAPDGNVLVRTWVEGMTAAEYRQAIARGERPIRQQEWREFPVEVMTKAEFRQAIAQEGGLSTMRTREVVSVSGRRLLQVEVPSPGEKAIGLGFRQGLNEGHGLWLTNVQSVDTSNFQFPVSVAFLSTNVAGTEGSIRRVIDMEPGGIEMARSNEGAAVIVPQGWFERNMRRPRGIVWRLGSTI